MPFAESARARFFYRQAVGEDPTLVFLHGNLGSSSWWRPVLERLPPGWRGLAPDALGHGYSDRSDRLDRFAISSQALDLAAFCDALALPEMHLIAHSTASPTAIEFTLAHPGRVATLVLVGPVPAGGVTTPDEAYPLLERMAEDRALLAQALQASAPGLFPQSADFQTLLDEAAGIGAHVLVATARAIDGWQPGERLRQLTLPVLLIRGDKDIMLSMQEANATLLAIPGANNLEIMHGAGHSPMLERPQAFAEVLVRFLSEQWEAYEEIRRSAE